MGATPTPLASIGLAVSILGLGLVIAPPLQNKGGTPKAKPAQKAPPKAKPSEGELLFVRSCGGCHGAKGQGGAGYGKPLTGTRSVAELAKFLHQQMPPGPTKTPLPQAQKIAAYMHEAFYSPLAQERNRPARVALTRLTVRQFRNAVTDLIGAHHPVLPAGTPQGLRAEYFRSRNPDARQRIINRIDPEVNFDFGTDGPEKDKFDPYSFSINWSGSVMAPDTGEYELIVRTENAVRVFLNNYERPFIDARVKSANETEVRGSMRLLGGRAYPLRIEFTKSTIGVNDDKDKTKKPPAKSGISLMWRRPKRVAEVIPARFLYPDGLATSFVISTPFPPDDRSIGYERGNNVSKAWDEATTAAALEAATYVAENLNQLTGTRPESADRKDKTIALCRRFVERAFRRPLEPEVAKLYVDRHFERNDIEGAAKRVVLLTLKSPRFLYREIGPSKGDAYRTASDLAFGLWDSLPDDELLRAAGEGRLATREQIQAQAERLANDPRSNAKLREFMMLWLKVDEVPDLVKSPKRFPEFDAVTASDLRSSLEIFLENTAVGPKGDYRQLILNPTVYLNGRLAKLYGANLPANAGFQPVQLDGGKRVGVLTQPYLLSRLAYLETTSPIHRGVLIARGLLGRNLQPPPAAFTPLAPSLHPKLTTRERVILQTKPAACASCHDMINPLGFTLERFDAVGRLRKDENGRTIDSSGAYLSRSGQRLTFTGSTDLARYVANSDEAHVAFVEKLFHHLVKQPVLAYRPNTLPRLRDQFEKDEFRIQRLMVNIMVETAAP